MQTRSHRTHPLAWLPALVVVAALCLAYALSDGFRTVLRHAYETFASGDSGRIGAWREQQGAWGPVLLYALALLQTVIPVLPSILVMIAAVVAYGPAWGGLIAWTGTVAAAVLAYGIGSGLGPISVDRLIGGKKREKLETVVERYGTWAIVAARISPVLSTDAVSYAAGVVRMPFVRFIAATGAGTLPLVVLIGAMGTSVMRLQTMLAIVSGAGLVGLLGYAVWKHRQATDG